MLQQTGPRLVRGYINIRRFDRRAHNVADHGRELMMKETGDPFIVGVVPARSLRIPESHAPVSDQLPVVNAQGSQMKRMNQSLQGSVSALAELCRTATYHLNVFALTPLGIIRFNQNLRRDQNCARVGVEPRRLWPARPEVR